MARKSMRGDWMAPSEVAEALGVTVNTALGLIRGGKVPGGEFLYAHEGRKGERWRVSREAFDAWLAARPKPAAGNG